MTNWRSEIQSVLDAGPDFSEDMTATEGWTNQYCTLSHVADYANAKYDDNGGGNYDALLVQPNHGAVAIGRIFKTVNWTDITDDHIVVVRGYVESDTVSQFAQLAIRLYQGASNTGAKQVYGSSLWETDDPDNTIDETQNTKMRECTAAFRMGDIKGAVSLPGTIDEIRLDVELGSVPGGNVHKCWWDTVRIYPPMSKGFHVITIDDNVSAGNFATLVQPVLDRITGTENGILTTYYGGSDYIGDTLDHIKLNFMLWASGSLPAGYTTAKSQGHYIAMHTAKAWAGADFSPARVDTANNLIETGTAAAVPHTLADGEEVYLWTSAGDLPDGLSEYTTYYAHTSSHSTTELTLHTSYADGVSGDNPVAISDQGTGTHHVTRNSSARNAEWDVQIANSDLSGTGFWATGGGSAWADDITGNLPGLILERTTGGMTGHSRIISPYIFDVYPIIPAGGANGADGFVLWENDHDKAKDAFNHAASSFGFSIVSGHLGDASARNEMLEHIVDVNTAIENGTQIGGAAGNAMECVTFGDLLASGTPGGLMRGYWDGGG